MKKWIWALGILTALQGKGAEIVAVVNDEPISSYDVSMRLKMLDLQQPGFSASEDGKTLRKKVLEQLIDEKVKTQEGIKRGYKVKDEDKEKAVRHLEGQLGLQNEGLRSVLANNGIPYKALEDQITSDLYWIQIMRSSDLPLTPVTDAEVAARMKFLKAELAVPGYLVSEIWVPQKEQAEEVQRALTAGQDFDVLAKQHSTVPSAVQGGLLGWVKQGYYDGAIEKVLEKTAVGETTPAIATKKGYVFIALHDKKAPKQDSIDIWELAQMGIPAGKISPVLESMLKTLNDCKSFMELADNIALESSVNRGQINPGQLPKALKEKLNQTEINQVVGPVDMSSVQMFFMVCQKQKKSLLPDKEQVREQMALEKTEKLSDKLLKSVRKKAIVEYK